VGRSEIVPGRAGGSDQNHRAIRTRLGAATVAAEDPRPITQLLGTAVEALGGSERRGQIEMAEAVANAFDTGEHLAVQAGTGTGKSLAYLVPAIARAVAGNEPVVVSTATIALQRQLVDRDLPRLADSLADALPRRPRFALLKGRSNYLCLNKLHNGSAAAEPGEQAQEELFEPFAFQGAAMSRSREEQSLSRDVQRLTEWSSATETGDRDEVTPGVPDRSWAQVSVSARECLGVARCPFGTECFPEKARAEAGHADVVVTNHALLAIDAIAEAAVLPEHRLLIVDEAHELVDRVTSVATGELSATVLGVANRRIVRLVSTELAQRLEAASATFTSAIHDAAPGRIDHLDDEMATFLTALRDAASKTRSSIDTSPSDPKAASARAEAASSLTDVSDTATRILTSFVPAIPDRSDVVWLDHENNRGTIRPVLRVAPLSVAGLLRTRLFEQSTAVLTSATLTVGGSFDAMATAWGLAAAPDEKAPLDRMSPAQRLRWRGIDVGSPFEHAKAGILYVAAHLPPPGRDGTGSGEQLDEIAALITAAGGRTLGLFSSMRAARSAAEVMRERLETPVLCQGEDTTSALVERFAADAETSLFGTLSLWQGVDVPGPSLSLVLIDRIPFPRPDDPLLTARQRAVAARGGNGFMAVAASHAALLLAQGAGRLLRRVDDRGVVAVLDSRMATARYGGYLRASLPPFWATTDPVRVRGALERLRAAD
jgi:ATP-dependent DNA helicase DinG